MSKNLRNQIDLYATSLSINNITIIAPQNVTYTWTLPTTVGSAGQFLTTTGSGVLSWTYAAEIVSGTFTGSSAVTVPLPDSGLITLKLSFVLNSNASEVKISGNTLLDGTGTNLPALEPQEMFTSSAGVNTSTFLADIVLDAASNHPCYVSIDLDMNRLGGANARLIFCSTGVYVRSAAGTVKVSTSGYLPTTSLSATFIPSTGTMTGSWQIIEY